MDQQERSESAPAEQASQHNHVSMHELATKLKTIEGHRRHLQRLQDQQPASYPIEQYSHMRSMMDAICITSSVLDSEIASVDSMEGVSALRAYLLSIGSELTEQSVNQLCGRISISRNIELKAVFELSVIEVCCQVIPGFGNRLSRANLGNSIQVRRPHGLIDIDTTPTMPEPPGAFVDLAMRSIPVLLADVMPDQEGFIQIEADRLASQVQKSGHSLGAAYWAIHRAIRAGYLLTAEAVFILPITGVWTGSRGMFGAPNTRRLELSGPPVTVKEISEGKPAPFDRFTVIATDALWHWWRIFASQPPEPEQQAAVHTSTESEPRPKRDKIAEALGVLAQHPDWTNKAIAIQVGCNANYLSQNERFKNARTALRRALPSGSKSKEGDVEAWEEDD
jgi:hypothetical protein